MTKLLLALCTVALTACGGSATVAPSAAPVRTDVVDSDASAGNGAAQAGRPALTTEVLPSFNRSGTLKAETPLLQRPTTASVILKTLAAGETVQILGDLDNADGHWRSIAVGDTQGWVRAAQVSP